MKILFIHNYYRQRGGEDVAFENESGLLQNHGHEVYSLVFKNEGIQKNRLKAGIHAIYNIVSAKKLQKAIKEFRPDVIHVHNIFFDSSPSVLFIAKKFRIPVVLTIHNYRLICCNALLLRDNKICELCINQTLPTHGIRYKCYRNSSIESALVTFITGSHKFLHTWKDKVTTYIVLTPFARSKLLSSSLGASGSQMTVKPNFVNDPGKGMSPRNNFFLFAGRIAPEKGIEILLEAFAGLPQHSLMIVGNGPDKERLEEKYKAYNNLTFAGEKTRAELLDTMKRCKALIVPSVWYEMLPFTIIEAFATGTPVLTSNLPSLSEIVQDGFNGICFNAGNTADIREKVNSFALNAEANSMLYENARKTFIDKYHPDQHYASIMAIYKNAILQNESYDK